MFSFSLAEDCDEGYIPNCNPQYITSDGNEVQACCPGEWIGDGYPDCEDQQWGCDLTCYSSSDSTEPDCATDSCSDGSDCSEDLIEVTIKNMNPTAINDTTGLLNVSLNSNKVIYNFTIQFTGINIYNTDQYESFLIEPPPDSDSDSDSIQDTIQVQIIDNQIVTTGLGLEYHGFCYLAYLDADLLSCGF